MSGAGDPEAQGLGLLAGLPPGHPALGLGGLGGLGFTAYRLWGHNGTPFLAARYPPALPPAGHSDHGGPSPTKDRGESVQLTVLPEK